MEGPKFLEEFTMDSLDSVMKTKRFAVNSKVGLSKETISADLVERKTHSLREKVTGTCEGKNSMAKCCWNNHLLRMKSGIRNSPGKHVNSTYLDKDQIASSTQEKDVDEYENLKKSLQRVTRTQQRIKREMNETKKSLNNKFDKIDKTYRTISADVKELSHMVELARFVNNRIERVSIKERLEKEFR